MTRDDKIPWKNQTTWKKATSRSLEGRYSYMLHRRKGPAKNGSEYWSFGYRFFWSDCKAAYSRQLIKNISFHTENDEATNRYSFVVIDGVSKLDSFFDEPTVTFLDGTKEWYQVNQLKKIVYPNGTKEFYSNNLLHRSYDFPAVEYSNGDKEWWSNGERHREEGPAIIYGNKRYFYKNGKFIKEMKCTI